MKISYLLLLPSVIGFTWPWQNNDNGEDTPDEDNDRNPYMPYQTQCPSAPLIREASNVSESEKNYIEARYEKTNEALIDFLTNVAQLNNFDAEDFINEYADDHNITIGLAFSGGGYRSMLTGAGSIQALDSRYRPSLSRALGGILQSSSYITGLSGGSWLVGTLIFNDWMTVDELLYGKGTEVPIWDLEDSIFNPNGINVFRTASYYTNIGTGVMAKSREFRTTLTDIWGRTLAHQFMPFEGGENVTWSSMTELPSFQDHNVPYPIVLANGRYPGTRIVNLNSTVFEFSPYEFGLWDPTVNSFISTKYLGTYLDGGVPNDTESCVVNFDNAGYVMGTSSTLFNQFLTRLDEFDVNALLKNIVDRILQRVERGDNDIAAYRPNPFYNSDYATVDSSLLEDEQLNLVDGSEDEQNIPLYPLIQQGRDVDVIFAFDNSGDTETEWPNGSAIIHTYRRQFAFQGRGSPIPFVPDTYEKFVDEGLNTRPTFFGCNASNLESLVAISGNEDMEATDIPLIIYIPNNNLSFESNTSSFKLTYDEEERFSMIQNGYEITSRSNLSDDRQWPTCVGCAIIRRNQERFGVEMSRECQRCFETYCWEPSEDDSNLEAVQSLADQISSLTATEDSSSTSSDSEVSSTSEPSLSSSTGDSTTVAALSTNEASLNSANSETSRGTSESLDSQSSDSGGTINNLLLLLLISFILNLF